MSVELSKDLLVDLGGWSVLKAAKGLQNAGCVVETEWEGKLLRGEVKVGEKVYYPTPEPPLYRFCREQVQLS